MGQALLKQPGGRCLGGTLPGDWPGCRGDLLLEAQESSPLHLSRMGGLRSSPWTSTIVVKCHSLQMAASVLNACALITQVQQTHLLRLDSDDIIYNTEDEKYDHAALKEIVIGFQTNLGLKSEILDHNLLQKLLQKAAEVDLVKLPTAQTTLPEE